MLDCGGRMAYAANAAQLVSALLSDAAIEAPPLAPASSQLQLPRRKQKCRATRARRILFGSGGPLWALLAQDSKAPVTCYCQFLCSECPLFPKADVQELQNPLKLGAAFGQERNSSCVRILLFDADCASSINISIIITRVANIYRPSSRASCPLAVL